MHLILSVLTLLVLASATPVQPPIPNPSPPITTEPTWHLLGFQTFTIPPPAVSWTRILFHSTAPPTTGMSGDSNATAGASREITQECYIEIDSVEDKFMPCAEKEPKGTMLWWKVGIDEVVLRKAYQRVSGQWVTGVARQEMHWTESNMTKWNGGTLRTRLSAWEFPIQYIIA